MVQRLAPFAQFSALKTSVEAFHATLQAARNTQQGTEGEMGAASKAAEGARQALVIGLYANVGRLMEKHAANPDELFGYFEVGLLRGSTPSLPTFGFNWQVAGMGVDVSLQVPAGISGSVHVLLREGAVELNTPTIASPSQTLHVTWPNVTIVDDMDEVLLRDGAGNDLARGLRDESISMTLP